MRLTLDSNILARAVTSPRGPALRLLGIIRHFHKLVLSRFILDEVERVLLYPRLQARYHITASEAARFTANLAAVAEMVVPVIVPPLVLSDPADDPVLYTAADGKVDILCTLNIRHFNAPEVRRFCVAQGIRIMTDVEVLQGLSDHGRLPAMTARTDVGPAARLCHAPFQLIEEIEHKCDVEVTPSSSSHSSRAAGKKNGTLLSFA